MKDMLTVVTEVPVPETLARLSLEMTGYDLPGGAAGGDPAPPSVRILVPAEMHRSVLTELVDELGTGDLRGAWGAIRDSLSPRYNPFDEAAKVLESARTAFSAFSDDVDGEVVYGSPVPRLREESSDDVAVATIVVITERELIEETLRTDWANTIEAELGAPVLHLYGDDDHDGTLTRP